MTQTERPRRMLVVTVHGTGDGDRADNRESQWWRPGSRFCLDLGDAIKRRRQDAEPVIEPVIWSGANNALDREAVAYDLVRKLKEASTGYDAVHVVAHSHGGNAATDAAIMLGWGSPRPACRLDTITTIGTPFLRNENSTLRRLGAYAFWAAAGLQFLLGASLVIASLAFGRFDIRLLALGAATIAFAAVFMAPEAMRGLRRIRRDGARVNEAAEVYSIRHENDEAIEGLRFVLNQPLEPFPRWSIVRGAIANGVSLGVWTMIVATIVSLIYSLIIGLGFLGLVENPGALGRLHNLWAADIIGNADSPVKLAIIVVLHALFSGTIFALFFIGLAAIAFFADVALRGWANNGVADALRGMALGSAGDQKPAFVESKSHAFRHKPGPLSTDVSERMRQEAREHTGKFLEEYRWRLLLAGASQPAIFDAMLKDPLTWKGLIHNRYFYQAEIVEMIADHIAGARAGVSKAA